MATAFAPGHVSGLFAVHDEAPDAMRKGSRGAGWSVAGGATATALPTTPQAHDSRNPPVPILTLAGQATSTHELAVTRAGLARLGPPAAQLAIDLRVDLPVGQGFGMSAAGTLAACLAACLELDLDPELALEATHMAEVTSGTGLGDAIGSWFGGGEIRIKPGCPPHGWAMRIEPPEGARMLYCVVGEPIPTPKIIRDAAWKQRTRDLGDAAVDRLLAGGRAASWNALLTEASAFSQALGLLTPRMHDAGRALPEGTPWGQAMLGHTLWAQPSPRHWNEAKNALERFGPVHDLATDGNGARRVRGP